MAMRRTRKDSRQTRFGFRLERVVGILCGVAIIVFVMALIWRGQPFADPNLARMARIILALGVGAVGATIPGFLHVDYSLNGFVIRGAGGMAMFLIAFFGSPTVEALNLRNGQLTLEPLELVEFRALNAPQDLTRLNLESEPSVTIYLKGVNDSDQLGRPVQIIRTTVDASIQDMAPLRFDWQYFVEHVTGDNRLGSTAESLHLGATSDAHTISVPPAGELDQSILHTPSHANPAVARWPWHAVLDAALMGRLQAVRVTLETRGLGTFTANCRIDPAYSKSVIDQAIARDAALPRYFLARCRDNATWTRSS